VGSVTRGPQSWPLIVNHPRVENTESFARNSLLKNRTAIIDLLTSVDAVVLAAKPISPSFAAEQKVLVTELCSMLGQYARLEESHAVWRSEHEARLRLVLQDILDNTQEYSTNLRGTFSSSRHRDFMASAGERARFEGESAETK